MNVAALLRGVVLAGVGIGQSPAPDAGRNVVASTVGIDGAALVWSLAYARALPIPGPRALLVATQLDLPMAQPDLGDWRGRASARIDALRWGRFAWPVELDIIVRRVSNRAVVGTGIGTELITMPGWYPRRWFVAGELSWDQQWTTHLVHSDDYREYVFDQVRDGWYRTTGVTMRVGARLGGQPWNRRAELWLRAGYERHGRYDTLAPPLYALAGVNFRF